MSEGRQRRRPKEANPTRDVLPREGLRSHEHISYALPHNGGSALGGAKGWLLMPGHYAIYHLHLCFSNRGKEVIPLISGSPMYDHNARSISSSRPRDQKKKPPLERRSESKASTYFQQVRPISGAQTERLQLRMSSFLQAWGSGYPFTCATNAAAVVPLVGPFGTQSLSGSRVSASRRRRPGDARWHYNLATPQGSQVLLV